MSPDAEAVLRERWSRSQRYVTAFSVFLPALQFLPCTAIVLLAGGGIISSAAIALVPIAVAALALRHWLRRQTPLDPSSWLPAAAIAVGAQQLSIAIPGYGIATGRTHDELTGPTVLFFGSWSVAAATCVAAHRASRALLKPLIAELGSADVRLPLDVRAAVSGPELVSAQIVVDHDRVEWTVRLYAGLGRGSRLDNSVPFRELIRVLPVTLPAVPVLRPWTVLPGGITLYAQAGPAVLLTSMNDEWLIPVHDAVLVTELLNRRQELWVLGTN
ncbi:hypothetical protein [Lentzea sp. NEAU-D7]|uniref:hypothetical protein n=1 Tax=Lentzea sp. NEAU-D7 TaxID=2994667 RepID=UPI00224A7540|nr:hypothetical protein [Lentzea sp. NEAU-D7]MCX2948831.1 hypothetical protein [Lentzea sp. NEAU-D7]